MFCPRLKSIIIPLLFSVFACSEDEGYMPIDIKTIDDEAEVFQDDSVIIPLFLNDVDLPIDAAIDFDTPQGGSILLLDQNDTPDNLLDDVLQYKANLDFEGLDTFSYTVCDTELASNCATASIQVMVKPRSFVHFDLANMPFDKLSDYNFFKGNLKELTPSYKVIPYELNSSLFSDYAKKKRFVWLPKGTKADFNDDFKPLNFPVGSMLIKNFYYENVAPNNSTKLIETRLMYLTETGWKFAEYVWNDDQTEAYYDDSGSFTSIAWSADGAEKTVNYRIPSKTECFTCHNSYGTPLPIGPKPQNLNKTITTGSGLKNQLQFLQEEGILEAYDTSAISSTVDWQDESESLELRVRSYLDINCAHCHSNQSYCDYRPVRFAFNENNQPKNLGVCVEPDVPLAPFEDIVTPGESAKSMLLFRMSTQEQQYRMPLLGRTLQHAEGVALIETWINSLQGQCE